MTTWDEETNIGMDSSRSTPTLTLRGGRLASFCKVHANEDLGCFPFMLSIVVS